MATAAAVTAVAVTVTESSAAIKVNIQDINGEFQSLQFTYFFNLVRIV